MAKRKLELEITEKGAKASQKNVQGLDSSFKNTLKTIGLVAAAVIALKKSFDFLAGSTKMALAQEKIFKKLENAVTITGKSWGKAKGELDSLFASLQATTVYGDTETADVFQKLIILTGDYDKAMTGLPIALNLASSGMFDIGTASRYIGMALTGNIEMLGRYISEFKATINPQLKQMDTAEKVAYAIEVLTEKFGGLAEAELISNPARIQQFTNYWGDFREMIGDKVTPALGKAAQMGTKFLKAILPDDMISKQYQEIVALDKLQSQYKVLSDELLNLAGKKNKTTYETQRYSKLLFILNTQYGDYLPNIIDETTAYNDLGAALGSARTQLVNFSKERIKILQIEDIQKQIAETENRFAKFSYFLEQYDLGTLVPQFRIDTTKWKEERVKAENELIFLKGSLERAAAEPVTLEPIFIIDMPELDMPGLKIEPFPLDVEIDEDQVFIDIEGAKIDEKIEDELGDLLVRPLVTVEMKYELKEQELQEHLGTLETWKSLGLDVSQDLAETWTELFGVKKSLYGSDSNEYFAAIEMKRQADEQYLEWQKEEWMKQHEFEMGLIDLGLNNTTDAIKTILDAEMSGAEAIKAIQQNLFDTGLGYLLDYAKEKLKQEIIISAISKTAAAEEIAQEGTTSAAITAIQVKQALKGAAISKAASTTAIIQAGITGSAVAASWASALFAVTAATLGANVPTALGAISGGLGITKGLVQAEKGFEGIIREPTMFMVGEGYKPEKVEITPISDLPSREPESRELITKPIIYHTQVDLSRLEREFGALRSENKALMSELLVIQSQILEKPAVEVTTIDTVEISRMTEIGNGKRAVTGE